MMAFPENPVLYQSYVDPITKTVYVWDGTQWVSGSTYVGSDSRVVACVETAAALRTYRRTDSTCQGAVQTLGALTPGDGGGGTWRWNASSTTSDNTGTVLLPTGHVGPGRWERVTPNYLTPQMFGAVADGVSDATAGLMAAAAASNGVVVIDGPLAIKTTCEVSASLDVQRGSLVIDSGVVMTVQSVTAPADRPFISGAGTFRTNNQTYCVAWWAGDSFNAKWDACRRGWVKSEYLEVMSGSPRVGDVACISGRFNASFGWRVTAPIQFDDPENLMRFRADATFIADDTFSGSAMFLFSPVNKTENITFTNGLLCDGRWVAPAGISINSGARVKFLGYTMMLDMAQYGVIMDLMNGTDEIEFDFLELTGFGLHGFFVNTGGFGVLVSMRIGFLFSNGSARVGYPAAGNLFRVRGLTTNVSIDKVFINIADGVYQDFGGPAFYLVATTQGSSYLFSLNNMFQTDAGKQKLLVTTKEAGVSGNSGRHAVHVSQIYWSLATGSRNTPSIIELDWARSCKIEGPFLNYADTIVIGPEAEFIYMDGIRPDQVTYTGSTPPKEVRIGGKQEFSWVIEDDTVLPVPLLGPLTTTLAVMEESDPAGSFFGWIRNTSAIHAVSTGTFTTAGYGAILTGTSGDDGKLNIGNSGAVLYIENRRGAAKTFHVCIG